MSAFEVDLFGLTGHTSLAAATTVAGLGTPAGAEIAYLRIGSSPYDLIALVYDPTYGKWVSVNIGVLNIGVSSATFNTTTYAGPSGGTVLYSGMSNFRRIWDAGLRPQLKVMVTMLASGGTPNARIGLAIQEFTNGDTGSTALGTVDSYSAFDSGDFVTSTSFKWFSTDWLAATMNAPSKDHVQFLPAARIASGTLTIGTLAYQLRWVSV